MPALLPEPSRFEAARSDYDRRIKSYARRHFRALPGTDAADLESELLEVLWLTCQAYDPNHGATFNTFFWTNAERRFLDLHKAASRQKRAGDYERVSIEADSVREVIAEISLEHSAEDQALARINVIELYRSGKKVR